MTPFESFKLYNALKLHFTSKSYDFIKYGGNTRVKEDSFDKRRDKYFFTKLSKHPDPKGLLVSNFIENTSIWVGDVLNNEEAERKYKEWKKRQQSISYIFEQETMKALEFGLDKLIKIENNAHPELLKLFLRKEISLESLIIFLDSSKCLGYWNKEMKDDPTWEWLSFLISKYKPFMTYDKDKCLKILKKCVKLS